MAETGSLIYVNSTPLMKKSTLLLTMFSLLFTPALLHAQKGLKVGGFGLPQWVQLYNMDDFNLDDDEFQSEALYGMSAGLLVGYNFNDFFGVRLNAIYSQQGGAYSVRQDINTRIRFVNRLDYFKIPLLIGFNTNPIDHKWIFTAYAGGQIGFLTRANSYNNDRNLSAPLPDNFFDFPSTFETYQSLTYAVVGHIGFDVQLPPDNFVLNLALRGEYNLVDAEDKSASFLINEGGSSRSQDYWDYARGATRNAESFGYTVGLLVGLTYTFP